MNKKRIVSFVLCLMMLVASFNVVFADDTSSGQIKNIIYMIPDGGGMEPFYLSDALKQAGGWNRDVYPNSTVTSEGPMYAMQYLVGAITTHSANADITDSAAAGTALSSGYKTKNGYIGVDPDKIPHATILEAAQSVGKNTGMVTTYEWTNATPATYSAHDNSRGNYAPMSEQIVNQGIDVVLGGGFGAAKWGSIADAEVRGYDIMNTKEDLENVKPGDKIWGNLVSGAFPYDIDKGAEIANIAEMTKAAITALNDDNENGFFLMVEGSKVDGGGHSNYVRGMVSEFLAFDEACKVALEFAEGRDDTLVVIVPDHDTGGMILPENLDKAVADLQQGIEPADVSWESTDHTARHGGMFMYVPEGVAYPEGISGKDIGTTKAYEENVVDNTVIAPYLADLIGVDMEALTKELFVDVTEMGTYDGGAEIFKFNDYPVFVKRNASYAFMGDRAVSLDGQVTLYINNRFYVPQLLLDIMEGKAEGADYGDVVYSINSYMDVYMPVTTDITHWNGRIYITNFLLEKELKGQIKFTAPANFAALDPIDIGTIGGGENKVIEFACPELDLEESGYTFDYDIITEDAAYSFSSPFQGLAYAGYVTTPIVIDGVIGEEEWANGIIMRCDQASQIVNIEDWKGDRDLSASFSMLWDEEYLYFYTVVTDEIFNQEEDAANLWKGDSVQFGLFNDTENAMAAGNAGSDNEEIGLAFIDGVPTAYRFRSQRDTTEVGLMDVEMQCVREGDDLTYECKFKWSELFGYDYSPKLGDTLGFSALINDDDGGGRRGWIEYGSGIGLTKDVNQFVKMLMLDFSVLNMGTSKDEITVIYNGEKIDFDVKPMLIDDRTMVPVRFIFEAMGATVTWDNDTETVISVLGEDSVTLQINNTKMFVNGVEKIIDVPAQLVNDRTLVPLRAVSESYGCTVEWDEATQTVTITK